VFARALIDKNKLKVNKSKIIFPLEIVFKEIKYLSTNLEDANGILHKCSFLKVDTYLYEEIISWDNDNIEIVFDL
jgi:hypothetical protein